MRGFLRCLILAALASSALIWSPARAVTAQGQQELVDRATLAAQDILNDSQGRDARNLLPRARAVMLCPRVFKAALFFAGGEGGGCVLVARGGQGSWSSPAFYSMVGGNVGFELGIQDAEIMLLILTENGFRSVLDNQFRLGAGASIALVTLGAGVEGATTTNLNADIVAFARPRGLFAGLAIQGSMMSADSAGNQVYYNQPVGAVDILLAMRVNNPAADPLRAVLMRFGAPAPAPVANPAYSQAPQGPQGYAQSYAAPPAYGDQGYAAPAGPVQQQSLPPPR